MSNGEADPGTGIQILYSEAHAFRRHLSNMGDLYTGLFFTILLATWSFFLKAYFDSDHENILYLVIPTVITSLVLAWWRSYDHYIDNKIASIYPELLDYEQRLGIPSLNYGTANYLIHSVPGVDAILNNRQLNNHRITLVSNLITLRRIGFRGQNYFDLFALLVLFLLFWFWIFTPIHLNSWLKGLVFGSLIVGLGITNYVWWRGHHNPPASLIQQLIDQTLNQPPSSSAQAVEPPATP